MTETFTTYYQSPLGLLQISGSNEYINKVHFIDDEKEEKGATTDNPILEQCMEELNEYFAGTRLLFDIPIYQQGTPFQTRVWNELAKINYGHTINYMTLAKCLGDPKCIRAAASTNGKNNIAIIVPCHRVIGTNNSLVGYAGGLWRKQWLLKHEGKIANGVQVLF